ncbi:hypothetical protein F5Y14DRAFT_411434 [Nemania sp. NC0429]|nr:hypothetical protein F5Y14DRAFT_411434 [Nemania sp. NC0429]
MAFAVFRNEAHKAQFLVGIITAPFAILSVVLRFWAVRRAGVKYGAEDWLALTALFLSISYFGVTTGDLIFAHGDNSVDLLHSPKRLILLRQLVYVALWLYFWQQLFVKLSILALYYRLFKVHRACALCIYALVAYHVLLTIGASLFLAFQCYPLLKWFNPLAPGRCVSEGTFVAVTESINSFGDFLIVILAVTMVRWLQMPASTKRKLSFLFGLGILAGLIGFIKIGVSYSNDAVYVFSLIAVWSNVQELVCLFCCCAPVYKPILPPPGMWSRLASKVSFSSLRQTRVRSKRSQQSLGEMERLENGQGWVHREDGSSRGLVWSEQQGHQDGNAALGREEYPLESIKVQNDFTIAR